MATTLNELLELAHTRRRGRLDGQGEQAADELATGLLELLGEDQPCGFEAPAVRGDGVGIPASWAAYVSPAEARLLAAMLLRAADEAEAA